MSRANLDLVNGVYAAFAQGDVPGVLEAMHPEIIWNEAENFPYADRNPYIGPQAVLEGVFMRLGTEWNDWTLDVEEVLASGDQVVARGRYNATHGTTGKPISAQFVHVWWVKDHKLSRFQQYADTAQVLRAMDSM
jgi:ketosteroid isomerase-like protein